VPIELLTALAALLAPLVPQRPEPVPFEGGELVPRSWLVLSPVDRVGRRPFRPDVVFLRHVLDPDAEPPSAGETLTGELGEAAWALREADAEGRLGGRIGYATTRIESAVERVVLAQLSGATTLIVGGRPTMGDRYSYDGGGWGGVPVLLRAGVNDVYVTGTRGAFRLALREPESSLVLGAWDLTLPDLTVGEAPAAEIGVLVMNASTEPAPGLWVETGGHPSLATTRWRLEPGLVPLGVRKVAVRIHPRKARERLSEEGVFRFTVRVGGHPDGTVVEQRVELAVRSAAAAAKHTRLSPIDDSVQEYAVLPPTSVETGATGESGPSPELRLLLTLHGAGVHALGQVRSYAPKPDFRIVAPTNRRPFGFDWQDWGRLDAYETLAATLGSIDRSRVYLTGHSMGGHGAWHLAANDPDGFAAVAPSAGWRGFDTYGGRPAGELQALWHAADGASLTEELVSNLASVPTFILHGEADDNVPAREGHAMESLLREAGGEPRAHFQEGAGHWWDAGVGPAVDCVDWPGFFELFRASEIPAAPAVLDFVSVDPGVDSEHHWISVDQPLEYGVPLRVGGRWVAETRSVEIRTSNVRRLRVRPPSDEAIGGIALDGNRWAVIETAPREHVFVHEGTTWTLTAEPIPAKEKRPDRSGPLKRGFDRSFLLVVPTKGDAHENGAALARARYDAGVWWYRANGDAPIATDDWYLTHPGRTRGRNVVLYGNADTNGAWDAVLPDSCPVRVTRGRVRLGGEQWSEDGLGALFVYPRRDDPDALVVALASSSPRADRLAATLALFVSGAGYPDYVVFGSDVLAQGDGGVRAAGFFDREWGLGGR
ncbi:MAG: prolyl oligopeptidase family serine peptidase, partial [Planctomycetota bacterium]|nr:prolyl oligopeptidase family serine peptidase [Planctomycetota bacterium]